MGGMGGMGMNQMGGMGGMRWDNDYYNNNYLTNTCLGGCPLNSHCEWGMCECNAGTTRRYGRCEQNWPSHVAPRPQNFDPFQSCSASTSCMTLDMNLVCNTDLTTQGRQGQCECRRDMRWNTAEGECQFYMDVDCSSFTYDPQASPTILEAVGRANTASQARQGSTTLEEALARTETKQESL